MIVRLQTVHGGVHYSIRDIYTNNEGAMIVRLENSEGRAWLEFPADELRPLIEGLKTNQSFSAQHEIGHMRRQAAEELGIEIPGAAKEHER